MREAMTKDREAKDLERLALDGERYINNNENNYNYKFIISTIGTFTASATSSWLTGARGAMWRRRESWRRTGCRRWLPASKGTGNSSNKYANKILILGTSEKSETV